MRPHTDFPVLQWLRSHMKTNSERTCKKMICMCTHTHTHTEICWRLCSLGQLVSSLCLLTSKLTSTHILSYFSWPRGDRWRIVHSKPPCPLFQLASFCFWILSNIKVHKETWFKVIKAQTCILQIIDLEKSNKTQNQYKVNHQSVCIYLSLLRQ